MLRFIPRTSLRHGGTSNSTGQEKPLQLVTLQAEETPTGRVIALRDGGVPPLLATCRRGRQFQFYELPHLRPSVVIFPLGGGPILRVVPFKRGETLILRMITL